MDLECNPFYLPHRVKEPNGILLSSSRVSASATDVWSDLVLYLLVSGRILGSVVKDLVSVL